MPEMVASFSSQRFSALLDFQRDVDLVCPSHIGKKNGPAWDELVPSKPNHHRARHGDNLSWQQNWSESLSAILFQRPSSTSSSSSSSSSSAMVGSSCAVEARKTSTLVRSQGQFSPQKFIRNALKRAFARDEPSVSAKRARFDDFGSTAEPMVLCA